MLDSTENQRYFSGPLNLYRKTKRADTVMGTQLLLDDRKFDALDMLVSFDGAPLSFERLYESAWGGEAGSVSADEALAELNDLIDQVEAAGEGFMRIEYVPDTGYSFRTHWGHNWQSEIRYDDTYALPESLLVIPAKAKKRDRRLVALLLTGAVAAAGAVVLIMTAVMNDLAAETQIINDATVPLFALPDRAETSSCMEEGGCMNPDECTGEGTCAEKFGGAETEEDEEDTDTEAEAEDNTEDDAD